MSNQKFFDNISSFYDEMISHKKVLADKKSILAGIVGEAATAADLGCGTGIDSIALSALGLEVTAFDQSVKMIEKAKTNAQKENTEIHFQNYMVSEIPEPFFNKFDTVISLGNTFANIPENDLLPSIKRVYSILKPGGKFIMQILNYDLIRNRNERIINITDDYENVYVRFYDIFESHFNFNILCYSKLNYKDRSLQTTRLYPYSFDIIETEIKKAGFAQINFYGNLFFNEFDTLESKDLVVKAVK